MLIVAGENSIDPGGATTAEAIVEDDEDELWVVVPNFGDMGGGELVNRRAASSAA